MKRMILAATAVILAGSLLAHAETKTKKAAASSSVTLTGEILDLSCYLGHDHSAGKDHAKCAKACLTGKGASAGLLTKDGKVYLLVGGHDNGDVYKTACNLGGEQAKVTGTKSDKGGLQAIVIEKVEKL